MNPLTPVHSRRRFLKQSPAAALLLPRIAPQILAKPAAGANDKLNIAWVGIRQ